jgi:prepilin-type N-terminal cleavage/methylation domain-containing protein
MIPQISPLKRDKGFTLTELAFSIAIMSIISIAVSTLLTASFQAQATHRTSALVEATAMNFTEQLRRDARLAIVANVNGALSDRIPPNAMPGQVLTTNPGRSLALFYVRNNGVLNQNLMVLYTVNNATGQIIRSANYDPERRLILNQVSNTVFVGTRLDGSQDPHGLVGRCVNLQNQNANSGNNVALNTTGCFTFTRTVLYNDSNPQEPTQLLQSFLTRVTVNGIQIGPPMSAQNDATRAAIQNDPNPIVFPVDAFGRPVYNIRQTSFELGGAKVFR